MEIVAVILFVVVGIWYFTLCRGRKTARAYIYLLEIGNGSSEFEANLVASRLDFFAASKLMNEAMQFVNLVYNGSQLTMISEARLAGFKE